VALESAVLLGKFLGLIGSFLHYFGMLLAVLGWSVIFVAVTMGFGAFLITRFRAAQTPPIEAPALVPPAPPASPQSYSVSGG
jgi:ABC-type multidrug transport system permease subunit